ncbi:MAG: hypothetical protein OXF73_06310 [Gammaproteobacteria bacterium]|nr:hypothetical protein [Gammaproteobacteria bacterium]
MKVRTPMQRVLSGGGRKPVLADPATVRQNLFESIRGTRAGL